MKAAAKSNVGKRRGNNEDRFKIDPDLGIFLLADGMGGEKVFIGRQMHRVARRMPLKERLHWVLQERIYLNAMKVHGILSRPRRVIADIAAYIHYDWNGARFTNFALGGFISRGTNKSLKVNVSGGGIQILFLGNLGLDIGHCSFHTGHISGHGFDFSLGVLALGTSAESPWRLLQPADPAVRLGPEDLPLSV
jgi:hypothetical protein